MSQTEGGGTLFLGPAERADVIIDFSAYAGQTLILYNDAPTAFPALDPHYDYYTANPDRRDMGGTFDDYGRMSAKLGLEVPFANAAIANFVLQNYVDPASEIVSNNEVQIWKITHNGVDTHPIHFHLFEVQVINRVGWDGFIRLPDPNELGWKDTVRIAPLEDTIVALRAKTPTLTFPLPDSIRPLNPARPAFTGDTMGFTQRDQLTGGPLLIPTINEMTNFGWEFVWHCHILSHEENDMMRPIVLIVLPEAPSGLATTGIGPTSLTWLDNAASETGFTLQRDTNPAFPAPTEFTVGPSSPGTVFGVTIPYSDGGTIAGPNYFYRVRSFSLNGNSAWST